MRGNQGFKFFLILLAIGILTYLAASGMPSLGIPNVSAQTTRLGIDIRGGMYTMLYPDLPEGVSPKEGDLQAARMVIEKRLDSKGIYDRNVTIESEHGRIIVEIPHKPGEKDFNPQKAIDELGKTALLTFQEVDEDKFDGYLPNGAKKYLPTGIIIVEGKNIERAGVSSNPETGGMDVTLELTEEGKHKFAEGTSRLLKKKIAIFMDDELIIAPTVEAVITNGEARITGQRDAKEAGELADIINAGALPFRLVANDINYITPLIGEGSLAVTINAGIIAFLIVFVFMLLYYRLPGLLAGIALFALVVIELCFITWLGITLTLPGLAGIILSIGMGVDANIIIFERIKEELRSGKTLRASADVGFKRAFKAILDANVTTLISAAVLYWFGTGAIKGFAVTLFVGVILSFFTAVTASRIMLKSVSEIGLAKNIWLYGVKQGVAK